MGKYLNTLNTKQKANIDFIVKRMAEKGITNPFVQAGILAVVSKESSFIPKSESDYSRTSNARIRKIFGRRVSDQSETQLMKLKKDPKMFFDKIYGGRYHNAANEGYKYRGRGLNQLTFKSNYEKANPFTDVDIVKFPDKLNDLPVATDVLIAYFNRAFAARNANFADYNMKNINDAKSTEDGVGVAYNANAGWGKSKAESERDPTGGFKKATDRVSEFYQLTKKSKGTSSTTSKNNLPIPFAKKGVVPYGKELQEFLNQFPGVSLIVDGWPGKKSSTAFRKVTGFYLKGDPRE